MIGPLYQTIEITDTMAGDVLYATLLARLAHLTIASTSSLLSPHEFDLIAGNDKWGKTVIKAFTLLADGKDYKQFLEHHAYENTPYVAKKAGEE
jgi:hypothetical protein